MMGAGGKATGTLLLLQIILRGACVSVGFHGNPPNSRRDISLKYEPHGGTG